MECCSICYDVIEDKATLSCSHSFCSLCIHQWLENHETCPLCRANISLMEIEEARVESFDECNDLPICPEVLAACGFYWVGYNDFTMCPFCDLLVRWSSGLCPLQYHQLMRPTCPFLKGKQNARHRPNIIVIHIE